MDWIGHKKRQPTIAIEDPEKAGDFRVIRASDFDPAIHTAFGGDSSGTAAAEKPEPEPPKRKRGRPRKKVL